MTLLPSLVRPDVLADHIFSGRLFDGEEAVGLVIATQVASDSIAVALAKAEAIASLSPDAIRAAKRLLRMRGDRAAILRAEAREASALIGMPNQREAMASGLEKRSPVYQD